MGSVMRTAFGLFWIFVLCSLALLGYLESAPQAASALGDLQHVPPRCAARSSPDTRLATLLPHFGVAGVLHARTRESAPSERA